jgi:hypothetical protein
MSIPNVHARRTLEEIVARLDTEAILRSIDEGGLSALVTEVASDELARRVLVEEVDFGLRARGASRRLDRAGGLVLVWSVYVVWLGWALGLAYRLMIAG